MEISEETMEKELLIEVKNMTKFFGPTQALKGVNLKFYRGEIRGLIGENGSGKSTVTSIIAGMQAASGGDLQRTKLETWQYGGSPEGRNQHGTSGSKHHTGLYSGREPAGWTV